MLFKKEVSISERSNVRFIKGEISFQRMTFNVYAFETDGVLIDTGSKTLRSHFNPFFQAADLDKILITHTHEDHTGNVGYLQKEFGLPVFMNELYIQESALKLNYPYYRQMFLGRREPFHAYPVEKEFDSRTAKWNAIKTPGHADDHLTFLNKETGQLFSGDLFIHPTVKVLLRTESVPTIIQSIERVLEYDFKEVFCCHAGYVPNGREAFTMKLHNLKELEENVLTLHKQGFTEKEITEQIFPKKYPITLVSLGEWNSRNITKSILRGI